MMSAVEVIEQLKQLPADDKEVAHSRADRLIIDWLLSRDATSRDVAEAWIAAHDRIGFWYA